MQHDLFVGVAREDITPKIGSRIFGYSPTQFSESVRDGLTVTVLAFQSGGKKTLLVTATVCEVDFGLTKQLRQEIGEKTGVDPDGIIIAATHTHSGPALVRMVGWGDIDYEYYEEIFRPRVVQAAEKAVKSMQPVTMGVAQGMSMVGINRRELNAKNEVVLGQSPWGCFNPVMTVISFKNKEEKIVANIIHYGAHGTAAGVNTAISRDWAGHMTDALDEVSGGVTAFFNGPEGDVGPRLSNGKTTGGGNLAYVEEMGKMAAEDAVRIFRTISEYGCADTDGSTEILKMPLKERMAYEDAARMNEKYKDQKINYGRKKLEYSIMVMDSHKNGYVEEEYRSVEQTLVRIGNIVFAGFPYELFSEIGMRIDQAEKELKVLSLSNANGDLGYFPTQDQLCRGGYEIDCFLYNDIQGYTDDADYQLMCETLRHLEKLKAQAEN